MIERRKQTRWRGANGIVNGDVKFRKVRAHTGDLLNEECDKLAKFAIGK